MAGQTGVIVTLDGGIHPPDTPLLHADDLAAVRGDGIFETLLVRDGGACLVESHLQRLIQSAKSMDMPEPDLPSWRRAIDAATRQWTAGTGDEGAMRLIYSRGRESGSPPTAYVMVSAVPERVTAVRRDGVAAVTLNRGLPAAGVDAMPWLLAGAKTLSYAVNMAVLRHAARQGAGDVIFVSSDGYILEGPRSTVVIVAESATGAGGILPADAAAVVSDPARHHAAGPLRGGPGQGLRLRLSRTACPGSACGPRDLADIEHDPGGPRAHARRPATAAIPDGRRIRRTGRRSHRQRSLSAEFCCGLARRRVRSAVHKEGGGPRN